MGGDFLRNASLQGRELVGHFEINYVRLGVRLTMAHYHIGFNGQGGLV